MERRRADGLNATPVGCTVTLTAVGLAAAERLRLAELGLRAGAVITVLARTAGGGRLLGIGTSRIAVDRATAQLLAVEAA